MMNCPESSNVARPATGPRKLILLICVVTGLATAGWWLTRPRPPALLTQGLAISHRDSARAETLFRRAIDASGGRYPDAQIGLCTVLARQDHWDEAVRRFAEIDPAECRAELMLEFGRAAVESDRVSEAQTALLVVGRGNSRVSSEAMDLLISGYRRWGLQNELLDAARELTARNPDRFDVWRTQVEIMRAMKLDKECLETAEEALRHDPPPEYRPEFQYLVVEMQISQADPAAATRELSRLRELEGNSPRARACAASIHRLEGRLDEALQAAMTLFDKPGRQPPAHHLIRGFILLDRGEFANALVDLRLAVDAQPYNTQASFKLAEAYRALGQQDEALVYARRANELSAKRLQINTLLKQRAGKSRNDGDVALQLTQLYEETGDPGAAAHWRRVAGIAP